MSTHLSLNSSILQALRTEWLQGVPEDPNAPLPPEVGKRWYMPNPTYDAQLKEKYEPALLDAIEQGESIAEKYGKSPEDALSIVLLLDQISRNIWRGEELPKVQDKADPLAQIVAKRFVQGLHHDRDPSFREVPWKRSWFYMPYMHSENKDLHAYVHDTVIPQWRDDCANSGEEVKKTIENAASFHASHRKVVEKFGRYPSRNKNLGRESTPEEIEFLKNGPGW